MKRIFITLFIALSALGSRADEGMWLPFLLGEKNYNEMVKLGLKLTPEQIYSINNSSMKDAIVRLGRGFCTGEMISSEGLLLTNHHCGYGSIQALSTVEHDYLSDGFWAMDRSKELPADFHVSFLVRIEDVTDQVTKDVTPGMSEDERFLTIHKAGEKLTEEAGKESKYYSAEVKNMFAGNAYYLFVYKTYKDVRLVGTPPESIGKYGGDTDNWMWPRHTGDFSMFRIYADSENEPAEYSKDNVPYKPSHHLPISLKGVEKGDYAMIWGYPGSTDRYLTSHGVKWATDYDQPARVKIRREKLDIYEQYQAESPEVRLQYASKYARVSNYWKYFIGQSKGLKRLHVAEKKEAQENAFQKWADGTEERRKMYSGVMDLYKDGYAITTPYRMHVTYLEEAIFGIEIISYAYNFSELKQLLKSGAGQGEIDIAVASLKARAESHFKDYYRPLDMDVFAAMIKFYAEDVPADQQPASFRKMVARYKGDYHKMAEKVFKKSFLDEKESVMAFLDKPKLKKLDKDPAYRLMADLVNNWRMNLSPKMKPGSDKLTQAKRLYIKGLMEMDPDKSFYPDANSTMRVTYGQVLDYYPADAVYYNYFTTMAGVIEKYQPGDLEFDLPKRVLELYKKKDFGQYGEDGVLKVCFLSNNDITGGNSGSPVINGDGELIGTAFDGNWEAMSGDIAFEKELQRTISVDIRYTLWIIDKFAGAGHLVEEMTIHK